MKPSAPIGGTVVLIIFMAMVLIMVITFLDVGPFPSMKNNMRQMAQDIQVTSEQLIAGEPSALPPFRHLIRRFPKHRQDRYGQ